MTLIVDLSATVIMLSVLPSIGRRSAVKLEDARRKVMEHLVVKCHSQPVQISIVEMSNITKVPNDDLLQALLRLDSAEHIIVHTYHAVMRLSNAMSNIALEDTGLPPVPRRFRLSDQNVRKLLDKNFKIVATAAGREGYEALNPEPKTDGLLGCLNRQQFDEDFPLAVKDSAEGKTPLSLLMIDIDHFKKVNDEHGHPAGDEVLKGVCASIKRCVAGHGHVYRYGGEEIAVVLPNASWKQAEEFAERIRKAVADVEIPYDQKHLKVTCSIGISESPSHANEVNAIIKKADEALYMSKNNGRNKTTISKS